MNKPILTAILIVCFLMPLSAKDRGIFIKKKESAKIQRIALVIGNSSYTGISALTNPKNDAEAMEQSLSKCGFKVIKVLDGKKDIINKAIYNFSNYLEKAQVGLFYYAGHAVQVEGINYIVPVEADLEKKYQLKSQCVQVNDILGAMEDANNKCNIVILDSCRNNPFKGLTRSASRGLARMNSPRGSLLVYATQPGGVASDGKEKNGVFTASFMKHMKTPNLEIMSLLRNVRNDVLDNTLDSQMPWESSSLTGEFYFTHNDAKQNGPQKAQNLPMEDISDSPKFNKNYRLTSINLDLISINAGGFSMGSSYHDRDEKPTHTVKLHEPFWIGKYEVTQDQYKGLMKINPSAIKGGSNPVDSVSWIDASKFCAVLNNLETKIIPQGYEFRLPTEAEWEYCAKAGKEKYDIDENNNICWHKYNSDKKHHKAGSKSSNPWGIYDMLGNVWEWVHDSYDSDFYSKSSNLRTFSNKGKDKVIRGGSWYDLQRFCRPGNRNHYNRDVSGDILGFRIVLAPKL